MNDSIRTSRLEITNDQGQVIAVFGATEEGRPRLAMLDNKGSELLRLELFEEGPAGGYSPSLLMYSEDKSLGIDIGVDSHIAAVQILRDDRITLEMSSDEDGLSELRMPLQSK